MNKNVAKVLLLVAGIIIFVWGVNAIFNDLAVIFRDIQAAFTGGKVIFVTVFGLAMDVLELLAGLFAIIAVATGSPKSKIIVNIFVVIFIILLVLDLIVFISSLVDKSLSFSNYVGVINYVLEIIVGIFYVVGGIGYKRH